MLGVCVRVSERVALVEAVSLRDVDRVIVAVVLDVPVHVRDGVTRRVFEPLSLAADRVKDWLRSSVSEAVDGLDDEREAEKLADLDDESESGKDADAVGVGVARCVRVCVGTRERDPVALPSAVGVADLDFGKESESERLGLGDFVRVPPRNLRVKVEDLTHSYLYVQSVVPAVLVTATAPSTSVKKDLNICRDGSKTVAANAPH
jgi:hypothetical protein